MCWNRNYGTARSPKIVPPEVHNRDTNDTYVNEINLNNVNNNATSNKRKRSPELESFANYIAEQLEDDHSLGFYRRIVDNMPENLIYQALSEVKDTYLTGRIKKSKAALFRTVMQNKARENYIDIGIKKRKWKSRKNNSNSKLKRRSCENYTALNLEAAGTFSTASLGEKCLK